MVIEGYADKDDKDKSRRLARARQPGARCSSSRTASTRARSSRLGKGEQAGRAGGVRVVEAPPPPRAADKAATPKRRSARAAAADTRADWHFALRVDDAR